MPQVDHAPTVAASPGATTGSGAPGRREYVLLAVLWAGMVLTEQVALHLFPVTLRQHSSNAGLIGAVLALGPALAFLAQPIAGIVSDRLRGSQRRRVRLLLLASPVVAAGLALVTLATHLVAIIALFAAIHCAQKVAWGAANPLIPDLVPRARRALMLGVLVCVSQAVAFVFLREGMGHLLETWGEATLYRLAAAVQLVLVAGVAVLMREPAGTADPSPPASIADCFRGLLVDRALRRFYLLATLQSYLFATSTGFAVLFAVQELRLSVSEFGAGWSWHALCMFVLAVPAGLAVERLGKGRVLAAAYGIAGVASIIGLSAQGVGALAAVAFVLGLSHVLINVTQRALFSEALPAHAIGQHTGTYSICLSAGRTLALAGGGALVALAGNNYRVIWWLTLAASLAAAAVAWGFTRAPGPPQRAS